MKYVAILFLVLVIYGGYVRDHQPQQWNAALDFLKVNVPKPAAVAVQPDTPSPTLGAASTIVPATVSPSTPTPAPLAATATNVVETPPSVPVVSRPFIPPNPLPAQAYWTWKTTDGKTYKNVVIAKVEADCVTILDDTGGSRISIATLPADIQKQLNYDPELAKIAMDARAKEDAYTTAGLAAEKQQLAQPQIKPQSQPLQPQVAQTNAPPTLTQVDKAAMLQQVSDLKEDINSKLRQIAAVYAQDGYAKAVSSQSAYRNAVTKEVEQLQDLQSKLGLKPTPNPTYYPFFPYYYFLSL